MTIPFKIKAIHTIYNTYTYIFTKTYNIIINPNSINSRPSHHVLNSLTACVAFMNDYEGQFVSEWRAFILQQGNKFRRQRFKAESFISRRIHNLKIVFLDPTIRTAELIFPKAIILNAKSLDRNCSSIMLRRETI